MRTHGSSTDSLAGRSRSGGGRMAAPSPIARASRHGACNVTAPCGHGPDHRRPMGQAVLQAATRRIPPTTAGARTRMGAHRRQRVVAARRGDGPHSPRTRPPGSWPVASRAAFHVSTGCSGRDCRHSARRTRRCRARGPFDGGCHLPQRPPQGSRGPLLSVHRRSHLCLLGEDQAAGQAGRGALGACPSITIPHRGPASRVPQEA